jgi:O-methyltransferase
MSDFEKIYDKCKGFTGASKERCFALYNSVRFIILNNIPGDFIECGVYHGGSAMIIAETLKSLSITDRTLYLFDTYSGMTPATEFDHDHSGLHANEIIANDENYLCVATIDKVKKNLSDTGYKKIKFVIGDVQKTLDGFIGQFSLVRLDTDFYDSTKSELENSWPQISNKGILIVDDYGHWLGARKAVDEYFKNPMINWIDYTGILIQKYE